jgi:hypothetical protein
MAMLAGTDVVVNPDESLASGSDLKLALYNADKATMVLPTLPTLGQTSGLGYSPQHPASAGEVALTQAGRVIILAELARRANAYASVLVTYWQANAVARVGAAVASLQKLPPSVVAGQPTAASGAAVDLPIF